MPSEDGPSTSEDAKVKLGTINATAIEKVTDQPDPNTQLEKQSLEVSQLKAQLRGLSQDIDERKKYAHRIFCLICLWLLSIFTILLLDGFGHFFGLSFSLPQGVLLAAIGSTTLNLLGIFYIVAHYLFPKK
jgi:hypothetical protein